jgi:hypothetical protein
MARIEQWLHGLFATLIGAFANAAGAALVMPDVFNWSQNGKRNLVKIIVVPTGLAVFAYLKQSPLWSEVSKVPVGTETCNEEASRDLE